MAVEPGHPTSFRALWDYVGESQPSLPPPQKLRFVVKLHSVNYLTSFRWIIFEPIEKIKL